LYSSTDGMNAIADASYSVGLKEKASEWADVRTPPAIEMQRSQSVLRNT
jgi:hypothetical protein